MNKFIDIGINLTNRQFNNETEAILQKAITAGVYKIILTGTSIRSSKDALHIAAKYPSFLYTTAGIHPHDAKSFDDETIGELKKMLTQQQVVAVGECGLDYDRDFSPRPIQEQCYAAHLQLAVEIGKPLFLHERAAFNRFNDITDQYLASLPNAVIHCFTGTAAEAKVYLDKGFYLGFTGAISDTKRFAQLADVIQFAPLDRIMIETDAPFMLPKNIPASLLTKFKERRNEPAFLPFVAETIAQLKSIPVELVSEHTTANALRFFGMEE